MRRQNAVTGLVLSALIFGCSFALGSTPERLVIPKLSHPPKIDGILDNPIWETQALKIENFLQLAPKEKGEPSEKTVAYVAYDEKNLYFAFQCYDTEPKKLRASITTRDSCFDDDWISIILDTFNEKRRATWLVVNPAGVQMDAVRIKRVVPTTQTRVGTLFGTRPPKIDDEGYTIEIASL